MSEAKVSDQPIEPSIETTTLQIDTIQAHSVKWKFRKGDETFWCEILDKGFLNRWRNHQEPFYSDDLLRVRLQTDQYVQNGQLKTGDRRILESKITFRSSSSPRSLVSELTNSIFGCASSSHRLG